MELFSLIAGPMFSGKSEELLRRCRRFLIGRKAVILFKPAVDIRGGVHAVSSRNGSTMEAIPVRDSEELSRRVYELETRPDVVAVDEIQFFDDGIVDVIDALAFSGVKVIAAGLDLDFAGRPFGPMPRLLCIADEVHKLTAVCMSCREDRATRTQRIRPDGKPALATDPLVLVGDLKDGYEARCRSCFSFG